MLQIAFTALAWQDYLFWQQRDKKTLKRINTLIKDIQRNPFDGLGKPEALRADLQGFYSRRIDKTHRLVYAVDNTTLTIISARYHYKK